MNNMPNQLKIDLPALLHNLNQVRRLVGQETKIMGVVKSDAYGHGMLPVSRKLEEAGIDCLGVAHLYEALELRKAGTRLPIVILCGILTRDESREVAENDLTPVVFDLSIAEALDQESAKLGKRTPIHLKVDTGMGRLGIPYEEVGQFIGRIAALKSLNVQALTSHLSSADENKGDFTKTQINNFKKAVDTGISFGLDLPFNNLANSAGIMGYKDARFNMVRPGIMLYGGLPSPEYKSPVPLKPAMHFKGRVMQIRDLPDKTPVSYGRTYYTEGRRRIAVLSAGYGDGLPRAMSNRGDVLVKGRKAPIVGTICMNLTMCDITGFEDIKTGEEVVFLGSQGQEAITGDDIGRWAGTISYEVFCSIGGRNIKDYLL